MENGECSTLGFRPLSTALRSPFSALSGNYQLSTIHYPLLMLFFGVLEENFLCQKSLVTPRA
jgi:hypothetical protein